MGILEGDAPVAVSWRDLVLEEKFTRLIVGVSGKWGRSLSRSTLP